MVAVMGAGSFGASFGMPVHQCIMHAMADKQAAEPNATGKPKTGERE